MPLINCPRFTAIKEGGKNNNSVYLDFGCPQEASRIPHIPVESVKNCTCFCESGIQLEVHDDRLDDRWGCCRGRWTFLPLSVVVPGWWCWAWRIVFHAPAVHHQFCLFCADGLAKIVTDHWELVNTVLYVGFGSSVQCTVMDEQKLDDISFYLGLCLKPSGVEDRAIRVVSNLDSIIRITKCIK